MGNGKIPVENIRRGRETSRLRVQSPAAGLGLQVASYQHPRASGSPPESRGHATAAASGAEPAMLSQSLLPQPCFKHYRRIDSAATQDIATEIAKQLPDLTARGNEAQSTPLPLSNQAAGQSCRANDLQFSDLA